VEIVRHDNPEDVKEEAKEQVRVVLASMKTKGGSKVNPNHLIKASQYLAGLMADLVGKTKAEAYKEKEKGELTDRAKAALDLDSMLSDMEASAKTSAASRPGATRPNSKPAAIQSLEAVLASLTAVASSAASAPRERGLSSAGRPVSSGPSSSKNSPAPKPQAATKSSNLADSINTVARDIQSRAADNEPISVVSRDLAAELQRFAKADQEKRRQDMLISGRAISSHIVRLTAEIKAIAARCKDVILQDKLIRHAQALRNFSVQLKILAAVRAASSTDDTSNSAQLANMTQALGDVLTDVSTTITILKKSRKI